MKHVFLLVALLTPNIVLADGDPARGKRAFLQCVMCHSAVPGGHKSGPSLASVWGRKAATVEGFWNYSDALKQADIVWNDVTLNEWLASPKTMVPGTSMRIPGVKDAEVRQDIIAYLKQLTTGSSAIDNDNNATAVRRTAKTADLTPLQSHLDTGTGGNPILMISARPRDAALLLNLNQQPIEQRLDVPNQ